MEALHGWLISPPPQDWTRLEQMRWPFCCWREVKVHGWAWPTLRGCMTLVCPPARPSTSYRPREYSNCSSWPATSVEERAPSPGLLAMSHRNCIFSITWGMEGEKEGRGIRRLHVFICLGGGREGGGSVFLHPPLLISNI